MAQVRELFSDLFAYVLLFEQTHLQGEFQSSYEQVRHEIAALLEQQKAAAKRQGMLEQDYHDACFAVVAWADETILKHSTWKHHNQWNTFPLQLEYWVLRVFGDLNFCSAALMLRGPWNLSLVYSSSLQGDNSVLMVAMLRAPRGR
jgi:Type VI secretion system protein DotU